MVQSISRTPLPAVVGGLVVVGTSELISEGRSSRLYHSLADRLVAPLVRCFSNPEHAHHLAIRLLKDYPHWAPTHRRSAEELSITIQQPICGLYFDNPIGLAAGFDKNAEGISALFNLGFGFVEVGSVCLRPQPGNPSPRMFRLVQDDAIINRYGFNSQGVHAVKHNLRSSIVRSAISTLPTVNTGIVGINLGTSKGTDSPLDEYQELIRELGPYADYFVINLSCPNQTGVRDLQSTDNLHSLVSGCDEARKKALLKMGLPTPTTRPPPPLFVKLSPDLKKQQLLAVAATLMELKKQGKLDGIIVSNTTTERPHGLRSEHKSVPGGLSGRPLAHKSTECIRVLYEATQGELPIIGVGGVFSAQDVMDKLKAGASVVQLYTGLVIQGPGLVSKIRHDLAVLMKQNGFRSIDEVIGLDHERLYWQRRLREANKK
jgi:dihydroorotate dehydrogenase